MNYNSIEEILSAGTTNMTIIRNNTKQDDGTDSVTGVSWFSYNGVVANTIYVNGNSWIGFGQSSEHLKVNRRDGALWSLYREEGTLYDYYKFLKIRWSGYSSYSYTSTNYKLEYDVILWDTGDISLHMVTIPTSYNNGTYTLTESSTYSYTVSSTTPDITFVKNDSGFTINNGTIELKFYNRRYLIRDNNIYYTVIDNVLTKIDVSNLTSSVFLNFGTTQMFDIMLLNTLNNPEVLFWTDADNGLQRGLLINGTPLLPQIVYYEPQNISGTSIGKAEVAASYDALFSISFDNKQTWKYYDYVNNKWINAVTNSEGMSASTIKNIPTSAWKSISTSKTFSFRCVLPTVDSTTSGIYIRYV